MDPEEAGCAACAQQPVVRHVALCVALSSSKVKCALMLPQVKSDWVGIIDHWAAAFFSEMDYEVEAENARL